MKDIGVADKIFLSQSREIKRNFNFSMKYNFNDSRCPLIILSTRNELFDLLSLTFLANILVLSVLGEHTASRDFLKLI